MIWQKETVEKLIEDFESAIQGKDARLAELEALHKNAALAAIEMQDKIVELEAQVGKLQLASAGSVIQLLHPDGCQCSICDNRDDEDLAN